MSHIIAVTNEKGGVAKTTTTLSLGAALVERGYDVLLVDLDTQANLTLALGIDPENISQSTAKILLESISIAGASRETGIPGLDIIPSNRDLSVAERLLPIRPNYENILRQALRNSKNLYYPFIIIDCPPFLGAVTSNAVMAANLVILPTQPEYFSIRALRSMMQIIRRARNQNNPTLTYRVLMTMFDGRNRSHRDFGEQLKTAFGHGLFETIIHTDTKIRECPVTGIPIIYYAPKSRAAGEYRALAQEIITIFK
jgi:chromosome partitioning protein